MTDLDRALRQSGFKVSAASATDARDRTLNVLEAKNGSVTLWIQNMPVNSWEDNRCKYLGDATIDPEQFMVATETTVIIGSVARASELSKQIRKSLETQGYLILDRPLACSRLATTR